MYTSLFLIEDNPVVKEALEDALEMEPDIEIVGYATDVHRALFQLDDLDPDVILFDIAVVPISHIHAIKRIRAACPTSWVLVLANDTNPLYFNHVKWYGANGYILKKSTWTEIVDAIHAVHDKVFYLDPKISGENIEIEPQHRGIRFSDTTKPVPIFA